MVTAKQRAWRKKFAARYGGKKKRSTRTRRRASNARTRTKVVYVGRRRRRYSTRRRRSSRSTGNKKIFGLSTKGLAIGGLGLLGVGAAAMFSDEIANMVPVDVPFKNMLVAAAIGGPAGVAAKFAKDTFIGGSSGSGGAFVG